MLIIKTTPEFDRWLAGIRDRMDKKIRDHGKLMDLYVTR
jgi:hypothetical protein